MSSITTKYYIFDNSRLMLLDIETPEAVDALVRYWRENCHVIITDETIGPEGTIFVKMNAGGMSFILTSDDMGVTEVHSESNDSLDKLREFVEKTVALVKP
ncbi:MAG: hypothetical protein ABFD49_05335 [Armatimonadota bacterium]|nr:hypothetical protein [bacterium]